MAKSKQGLRRLKMLLHALRQQFNQLAAKLITYIKVIQDDFQYVAARTDAPIDARLKQLRR